MSSTRQRSIYRSNSSQKQYPSRYNARQGRKRYVRSIIGRSMPTKGHMFKQLYRPSSTAFTIGGAATGAAYDPNEGILFGPDPASTAGDGFFSIKFLLSDLPQASTLGSLFDAYRINRVVISFTPMLGAYTGINGVSAASTGTFDEPLYTVLDRDDISVPTSLSQLEEYESLKMTPSYRKHKRVFTPAIAAEVYKASGVTNGYSQKYKQWIDIASNDTDHYGIKGCIQGPSTAGNARRAAWMVRAKLYFQCKQVR